jgi:hypothetical protein
LRYNFYIHSPTHGIAKPPQLTAIYFSQKNTLRTLFFM